ncbi:MAG: hypothetical protein U0670_21970 [Anaerolineae bacterium]
MTLEQTYANAAPVPENRVLLDLLTRKAMIDFRAQALNSSKQLSFPFDPELGDVVSWARKASSTARSPISSAMR